MTPSSYLHINILGHRHAPCLLKDVAHNQSSATRVNCALCAAPILSQHPCKLRGFPKPRTHTLLVHCGCMQAATFTSPNPEQFANSLISPEHTQLSPPPTLASLLLSIRFSTSPGPVSHYQQACTKPLTQYTHTRSLMTWSDPPNHQSCVHRCRTLLGAQKAPRLQPSAAQCLQTRAP